MRAWPETFIALDSQVPEACSGLQRDFLAIKGHYLGKAGDPKVFVKMGYFCVYMYKEMFDVYLCGHNKRWVLNGYAVVATNEQCSSTLNAVVKLWY